MANGLPPLEKLKKKELPPLNSLKKKGDGTPQPETTSQPTGVITQPLAQGSQQGTQPPVSFDPTSINIYGDTPEGRAKAETERRKAQAEEEYNLEQGFADVTSDIIKVENLINELDQAQQLKQQTESIVEFGTVGFKQGVGVEQMPPKETTTTLSNGITVSIPTDLTREQAREQAVKQAAPTLNKKVRELVGVDIIDEKTGEVNAPVAQYVTSVGSKELEKQFEFQQNKIEQIVRENNRFQSAFKSGVLNIAGGLTGIVDPKGAQLILENAQTYKTSAAIDAGLTEQDIENGIVGNLTEGNFKAGLTNLYLEAFSQTPQLALMYMTGGTAGIGILGASAGGAEYARLYDRVDISNGEKMLRASLIGITEALTERLGSGDINIALRVLGQKEIKNIGIDVLKNIKSPFAKQFLEEGGEELIAGFTEQLINKIADGEDFDVNSLIDQALIGGVSVTPTTALAYTVSKGQYAIASKQNQLLYSQGKEEISSINEALNTQGISQEEKDVLTKRKERIQSELLEKSIEDLVFYNQFSEEDLNRVYDINEELTNISAKKEAALTDVAKTEYDEQIKTLAQEKQAIENKYVTPQEMSSKTGEILDTEKTPVVTEEEEKAPEVFEEEIVIPEEEIEKLNYDIARVEDEGTFGDNINQKAYRGSEEGMIKIDPQNENTIIFETNDKIYELGNKDEIGSELLSSQDITLTPPEGVNVVPKTNKTDVVSIDGKEYTVIGRRRDKKGKAVVRVKEVDTGLERRFVGEKAERILKDYNLRQGGKKVDIPDVKKQTEKPVVKTETKEEKRARKVEEKRKLEEMNQQEFDDAVAKSEKEVAEFEKAALDEAVKKAEKNKNKDLVQVNGNVYQVTKKDDGTFSVTKMREDGKLVRITDKAETSKAVAQFKREKTNQEKAALKEAEKMIKDVKKEEQDKILNLLDKLIDSTSSRGRVYDATLALPMFVANSSLKIVRASYKAGKSIAEAIKDGYNYVKSKGYGITEQEYKKYVAQNINKQQQSDTQDKTGIPSKEQKGQEPKQAKPKQEASGEKAETGRDVQTPKEKGRVTPDKTKEEVRVEPDEKEVKEVAEKAGITPKNLKDLYKIGRDMFGLNKVQAFAQAVVMDRMIGAMAKRAGVSKQEMYGKISFKKGSVAPKGSLKQAASNIWKSTAKEGISKIQQKAATPEQWVKMINDKGGKGTSQELEWIGLADFLSDYVKENNVKSVPKEVVEQYIADNQIEIVDVSKGDLTPKEIQKRDNIQEKINRIGEKIVVARLNGNEELVLQLENEQEQLFDELKPLSDLTNRTVTRYSQYTLEGGENYREVLLTLPNNKKSDQKFYKKQHFDEANILAHLRLNERTLPNGERVLFIEEVQSDWAQEGKKRGFYVGLNEQEKKEKDKLLFAIRRTVEEQEKNEKNSYNYVRLEETADKLRKRYRKLQLKEVEGVAKMPYKKTDQWVGMAMRRAMQMAANEGFDRIAWVTGEQSADRYDLSKQVDTVGYNGKKDGTYDVVVKDFGGRDLLNKNMTIDEIESTLGKEVANKIQSNEHGDDISTTDAVERQIWEENGYVTEGVLEGENLKVGGEGMKAFYNSILPKVAKKEAQRFDKNAKVEVADFGGVSDAEHAENIKKVGVYNRIVAEENNFMDELNVLKPTEEQRKQYEGILKRKEEARKNLPKQAIVGEQGRGMADYPLENNTPSKQLSIAITPKMRMNLNGAVPLFQGEQGAMLAEDGKYIIYALTDPNVSTPLHELAHVFEHYLTEAERTSVLKWANSKEWTVDVSEKFARGFEKFLADGKAPTANLQKIFNKFKEWLTDIYNGITNSEIDIKLNKPMQDIYSRMLGEETQAPTEKEVEDVAKKTGITPKNLRDLYKINRDMFGLNKVKAFAQAVVMDRMVGAMAKRAGISKKEMYGKIEFRKASEKELPQGVMFQVDAWHGSPYQFDKFTTEKMGTGEGAQAFGWGLYFTDLESIARGYADRLRIGNEGVVINNIAQEALNSHKGDVKKALEELNSTLKESWADKKRVKKAIKILETGKFIKIPKTNLYKVSLHKGKTPDQYTWLEWDKPVSNEQWNKLDKQVETEFGERAFYEFVKNNKNAFNGETIYKEFSKFIGGDKEASLFLLRAGIDGVKYPAESISRGATSDTARGFNYVVFDENAVSIEEVIKFQKDAVKARGAMMMAMDGKAIIYALEDPNVSTPLHELAHVFEHYLTEAERNSVLKWANSKEWTVDVSEKFARGFEKYLADGKAPTVSLQKIFNRFKEWLTDIYNGIVGSDIDIQLNDEMRDLYGKMLGVDAVKEQEKKSFANIIRGLKIDTTGKAFDATLGLPVAIYNNAIEITAKAVEAGVEVKKAIQKGIDYANKKMNGKKWDVEGFRNQLLTTIKGQFEQQAAQMRSSKKEVKTPKTRFLGFLTRSGAKIVNANDYIDSMKTNMNLDVSDTKKRIDDAKSKARKVFAKTNKIKNDKKVANIVNDLLNRIISPDEYNMTAQEAIDKIRKDIKNPKVAQELIDAGLDIRTQIDNMTKFMLENAEKFNLSDEAIENLKSNIGNYIHREYMFFSERGKTFRKQSLKTRRLEKWNPTDEMINEAIAEHAIYNGISVDEAKKQIEDLIEDWKKKRTPIKVTGNNVIRIQDVKVEADLMKGRVRIPQNFTLFSEASKEAEKELQKKGIDSENKNYNTLLSVETERIYKDKGGEYVELPPHLRKLLGEERNATQRYINTMLAMSNMVYKAQAMDMIVKSFDGKDGWIYDKEPANNEGDYKLVNDKYSPLNGKWVNIYLIEEFNKLPIYETDLAIAKAYFEYQSLVRTTKTVANSPTNFKNVIGGIFAQMQNGFFIALTNPKLAALSIYSRGHLYFKGRRNELAKQVLKDGAEAGVLSSSVDVEVLGLKGSILSERVKFGKSELGRRYAQQDDWTKSLMVYLYKQDVSLMLFGKKFDDLSKDQQKEVLIKTGSLTKKGVPTFSNLPSWFRTISRLPTGDFMSFTVEATRSLIGSGIIAYEHARAASTGVDSKGNTINETQRRAYAKDAAKRIAGLVAIQSVGKAIGAGAFSLGGSAIEYGSQVFAAIFGGGDDEDENDETKLAKIQVVKEINKTIPDWAVGDRVMVTNVDDDGNVTFYNWTGLEPSSETAQLIGGNFKYFEQFYKGSITAKMLIQLYNNENEIGNEIYLEDEPLYKQVFNSAYFLGKNTLLPPFINSTEYEIKRRKEDDENFGVISQDNTVEENAQSAKELTQVFLSRATIRSYNYNIYNRVKQIAYAQSRHGRVDNLDNIKEEEQIDLRLKNISVIRDAYQICLKHRITTSDSPAKIKKISELNDAVKRNYTDFEEAMIYETDDAKFKEMYDFVMSKSKDIVEYNKLKDERKK